MIDDKKHGLAPKQGYHAKSQRFAGRIHYSVSLINDIGAWKREQAEKQAAWDQGSPKRYEVTKQRAVNMLQDEAALNKALKEQNKRAAGVEIDRIDAIKLEKARQTNEGKFIYTPDAEIPQDKCVFLAIFRRLFT
jgi:hypothetical protein